MLLPHAEDIVADYDAFLLDLWGVVHNGQTPYPAALAFMHQVKNLGKKTILLSNAPRRAASTQVRLRELGVTDEMYHALYTSGEDFYQTLKDGLVEPYTQLKPAFYHLGPDKDACLYRGLAYIQTDLISEAGFLLNSGTSDWHETVEDYRAVLDEALARKLLMICPNPDRVVVYRGEKAVCAGGLADYYAEQGGDVHYHGKPFPSIYDAVRKRFLADIPIQRILAIGDSLATDVRGGFQAQIDTLWVLGGIHQSDTQTEEGILELCKQYAVTPTYIQQELRW